MASISRSGWARPVGEQLGLALRRETGALGRLGATRLDPRQSVDDRLGERAGYEPGGSVPGRSIRRASTRPGPRSTTAAVSRSRPARRARGRRPRCSVVPSGPTASTRRVEQVLEAERKPGADAVEGAGRPGLGQLDRPRALVARVDDLHRRRPGPGCQDLSACGDPPYPPGETEGVVVGPDDVRRAGRSSRCPRRTQRPRRVRTAPSGRRTSRS